MFEYAALVDAPVQRFTGIVTGPDPDDVPTLAVRARAAEPMVPSTPAVPPTLAPELAPSQPMAAQLPMSMVADPARRPSAASPDASSLHSAPARAARPRPHQPAVLPAVAAAAAVALSALWLIRRGPHGRAR